MAKSSTTLHIVANQGTKRILAELGKPVVNVSVRGRLVKQNNNSVLVLENISTQKTRSLPIVNNSITKRKLGDLAKAGASTEIVLNGSVVDNGSSNVLMLSNVVASKSLPLIASDDTKRTLAELSETGQEVTIKARVVQGRAGKMLVLDSGKGNNKKK